MEKSARKRGDGYKQEMVGERDLIVVCCVATDHIHQSTASPHLHHEIKHEKTDSLTTVVTS